MRACPRQEIYRLCDWLASSFTSLTNHHSQGNFLKTYVSGWPGSCLAWISPRVGSCSSSARSATAVRPVGTGCPRSSAGLSDASIAIISTEVGSVQYTYHLNFLAIILLVNEYLVFKVVSLALWN